MIRRKLTETEWKMVRDNLPHRLRPLMDEIEFVTENCWGCEHHFKQRCLLHNNEIPHEEMGRVQPCFSILVEPF